MARIGISFKDNSPEEMKLYEEILKRACGSPSHYIKGVFRELFEMDGYIYQVKRTKKDEDETSDEEATEENPNEEVAATSDEQEEPQKAQEKEERYSDDYDQELDDEDDDYHYNCVYDNEDTDDDELELEELPEVTKPNRETVDNDKKEERKTPYKPMNIGSCLQAFEKVNK